MAFDQSTGVEASALQTHDQFKQHLKLMSYLFGVDMKN